MIAAGGGGIPTAYEPGRRLTGIEAVIDKDLCSELMARQLEADVFIMATDVDAVYVDWGKPEARAIRRASPEALIGGGFPAGSMGPKVAAACRFAERSGKRAAIGALKDLEAILRGEAGTTVTVEAAPLEWATGFIRRITRRLTLLACTSSFDEVISHPGRAPCDRGR